MSKSIIELCSLILQECHGELADKICIHLLKNGPAPLRSIKTNTHIKLEQVKKVLCMLIQHNIVKFKQQAKGTVEYSTDFNSILWRTRYPKYIYCAKTLYGDSAELLVEEILHNGQSKVHTVIESVTERLNEALEASGHQKISSQLVRDKLANLMMTHFIQKCSPFKKDANDKVISMEELEDKEELFVFPQFMEIDGSSNSKRKRLSDDFSRPSKRLKSTDTEDGTESIYCCLNFERFHHHFRDQTFIDAIQRKVDKNAAEILRTMLRLSEVISDPLAPITNTLTVPEIFRALPKDLPVTKHLLEQYLTILEEDSLGLVIRMGDRGSGEYVINIFKGLKSCCIAHIESVVLERFGSKSLRIFRVLLLKRNLEQKQIEEYGMVPAKEAKEMLYTLFQEHFVTMTEVSKTPDHAPSRTFYLFSVDINKVAMMLLERCYKSLSNGIRRRQHEVNEHKRVLDKQERVDAIIASLEHNGGDATQKEEIEQTITPHERSQLDRVKSVVNKLDNAEIQTSETIFLLETYLQYVFRESKLNVPKRQTK